MKVFTYCASRNHNSKTREVVNMFLAKMRKYIEIDGIFYTPNNLELLPCRGCTSCFQGKGCRLDCKDNFSNIKKEMLSADVVIFATPVYACTISGDLKIFIDRISYLIHLLALRGKIGIPIVTASTNSLIETNDYLDRIMNYLGAKVPFSILCTVDFPKQFDSNEFQNVKLEEYAKKAVNLYLGRENYIVKKVQELYYQKMKKQYKEILGKTAEAIYWEENGLLSYNSYQDILDELMINKKF